jgi:hypothetical protein
MAKISMCIDVIEEEIFVEEAYTSPKATTMTFGDIFEPL